MKGRPWFSRAQTMVIITLVMPVLLAGIGIAADIGIVYFNWVQLQKAADAAAIAGAEYLAASPAATPIPPSFASGCGGKGSTAQDVACTYVTYNSALPAEFSSSVPAASAPASVPAGVQTIQVNLSRPNVPTYFLRLVGLNSLAVNAQAIAMAPTCIPGGGTGLLPIGVPTVMPSGISTDKVPLNTPVTLVQYGGGNGAVAPGNWEWLNIPDGYTAPMTPTPAQSGGNSQLASTITNGCSGCDVQTASYLSPQTGGGGSSNNVANAIGARITSTANGPGVSVNTSGNTWSNSGPPSPVTSMWTNSPALVTMPVVNWTNTNGSQPVQVMGFITAWLVNYTKGGGSGSSANPDSLTVEFLDVPTPIQTTNGPCINPYPGITQAKLVQ